jgi:hypothetical protein
VFFGHINNVPFKSLDPHPRTQALKYCAHVYDGVSFSPGSSQLSPDELQYVFTTYMRVEIDAAIFSCVSFPSWFSIQVPGSSTNPTMGSELNQ